MNNPAFTEIIYRLPIYILIGCLWYLISRLIKDRITKDIISNIFMFSLLIAPAFVGYKYIGSGGTIFFYWFFYLRERIIHYPSKKRQFILIGVILGTFAFSIGLRFFLGLPK